MTRYAALLRGINVGRAKRIGMAALRETIEGLGYSQVGTLLNSGNVVLGAPPQRPERIAARIEAALPARLGVTARVVVLLAEELAAIVAENPLASVMTDPARLLVSIPADQDGTALLRPLLAKWGDDRFGLGGRAAYLWCPDGVLASHLPDAVDKALGGAVTTRNWATVLKLERLSRPA